MASIPPPSDTIPKPGDILAGKFRIERVLGVGGMGVVLAAMHIELRERVALKLLLPAFAGNPRWSERFLREARAAVRIKSRHVARAYDVGRLPDGAPYIAMEFLDGKDLSQALSKQGVFSPSRAVDVVLEACEAIAEAHQLGIVHRDLKPSNLFLASDPSGAQLVKVLDFGISKVVTGVGDESAGDLALTKTTDIMGSPLYMSPEQLVSSKDVDARSDVWALGVVLYELIAGEPPFNGNSLPELCGKILHTTPTPLSNVPPAFWDAVVVALRKDPKERFASIADFALAFAPFGSDSANASVARILRDVGAPATRTLIPSTGGSLPMLPALADSASPLAASMVAPQAGVAAPQTGSQLEPRQFGGTSAAVVSNPGSQTHSPTEGRSRLLAVALVVPLLALLGVGGFVGLRYKNRLNAQTTTLGAGEVPLLMSSSPPLLATPSSTAAPSESVAVAPAESTRVVPVSPRPRPSALPAGSAHVVAAASQVAAVPTPAAVAPDAGAKRSDGRASSRKDE